jgi:prolyl oligopeptidase PreP (S9A serine peptidase family)
MFIAAAGPGDITAHSQNLNEQMARYWGATGGNTDNVRKASPIFLIPQPGAKIPPGVIIQGLMDGTVDPQQSIDFAAELLKKGASEVIFMGLPFAGHTTVNQRYYLFEEQMFRLLQFAQRNLNRK